MKQYYYKDGDTQHGPLTFQELKGRSIKANTPVWHDPLPQWTTADQVAELRELFAPATNPSDRQYYYKENGSQFGPFPLKKLHGKPIGKETPVWYHPLPNWTTAGEVDELKPIIEAAPKPAEREYYYKTGTTQHGPFKLAELKDKNIHAGTPLWYHPLTQWTTGGQVEELKPMLVAAPAEPETIALETPAAGPVVEKKYYYKEGQAQFGPFSLKELESKNITTATMVWYHPLPNWKTAVEMEELKPILKEPASFSERQYYYKDGSTQYGPLLLQELKGKRITSATPMWYHPLPKWTTAADIPELKDILVDNPAAAVSAAVSSQPVSTERQYYYKQGTTQHGPFEFKDLRGKNITASTPLWYHPLQNWTTAGAIPELKEILVAEPAGQSGAPATAASTERQYYYKEGTKQFGPLPLKELKGKNITAATPVWYQPLPNWTIAGEVAELKEILVAQPVSPASSATTAPVSFGERQYYIKDGATQLGPFVLKDLKGKNIGPNTPVWYHPLPKWTTVGQIHEIMELLNTPVPVTERQYFYRQGQSQSGPYQLKELRGKGIVANTPMWYHPLPKWTTAGQLREVMDFLNAPVPLSERQYFFKDGRGQYGPYSLQELAGRNITANTPIWYHPLPNWTTAGYLEELGPIISGTKTSDGPKPESAQQGNGTGAEEKQYFYKDGDGQHGPISLSALKDKNIKADTPVWYHPLPQWTTAGQVKELREVIVASTSSQTAGGSTSASAKETIGESAKDSAIITPSGIAKNEEVKSQVNHPQPGTAFKSTAQSQAIKPGPTGTSRHGFSTGTGQRRSGNTGAGSNWFVWIVILAVVGGGAYFGYAYFIKDSKQNNTVTETIRGNDATNNNELAQGSLPASSTDLTFSDTTASFSAESNKGSTTVASTRDSRSKKTKTTNKPDSKAAAIEAQLREEEERRKTAEASAKEAHSKESQIRNNWSSFITFGKLDYKASGLGGIKEFDVRVFNSTDYVMDEVKVRLDYIKSGGGVFKSETIVLKNIPARAGVFSKAPESKRGTKVNAYITAVSSRQLHLCYPLNNGNSNDPYYCN